MDPALATAVASILVSLIAAGSGWATNRAARNASTVNTLTTSRTKMEEEAYERARKIDTETIARQDQELEELRDENKELRTELLLVQTENKGLLKELAHLERRISRLEMP